MRTEIAIESRFQPARLPAIQGALLTLDTELKKDSDCVRTLLAEAPQLLASDPDFLSESLTLLDDNLASYRHLICLLLRHELDTTRCLHALRELEGLIRQYADRVGQLLSAASDAA